MHRHPPTDRHIGPCTDSTLQLFGSPPPTPRPSPAQPAYEYRPPDCHSGRQQPPTPAWLTDFGGAHTTAADCSPGKAVRFFDGPTLPRPPGQAIFCRPWPDSALPLLVSPSAPHRSTKFSIRPLSDPPPTALPSAMKARRLGILPASSPGPERSEFHSPPIRTRCNPGLPALRGPGQPPSADHSARKDHSATTGRGGRGFWLLRGLSRESYSICSSRSRTAADNAMAPVPRP
jgi:hypothetical protein